MEPHVYFGLDVPWHSYEIPNEIIEPNQSKNEDADMSSSQDLHFSSEGLALSSYPSYSSMSGSTDFSSANSSNSESSQTDLSERMSEIHTAKQALNAQQRQSGILSHASGVLGNCIDPRLIVSGTDLSDEGSISQVRHWDGNGQVACGHAAVDKLDSEVPELLLPNSSQHYPTNEFDIAFDENSVTVLDVDRGPQMWLRTWVARHPDRLPNQVKLESLKTLSGLSEIEIVTWLRQHVLVGSYPEAESVVINIEETLRQKPTLRYRPECRRSPRRFRNIPETRDETRVLECTHGCGQSFDVTGQWARHERSNIEKWKCHICKYMSPRKDKLRKHLKQRHGFHGDLKKSHCHQLLRPEDRPCGFCLKQFHNWSEWINHVGAHFQGRIPGGPWTMARWNKVVDGRFNLGDSDDDGDDGDDDDQGHNDEDETSPDSDSSNANSNSDSLTKGKGASYGSGSKGLSRPPDTSTSDSTSTRNPRSRKRAGGEPLYREHSCSTNGDYDDRPFKCPDMDCRYCEQGRPTQKERDRHIDSKHSARSRQYHSTYFHFKTKHESNCKQHMEKKHGRQYDSDKGSATTVGIPPVPVPVLPLPLLAPQRVTQNQVDHPTTLETSSDISLESEQSVWDAVTDESVRIRRKRTAVNVPLCSRVVVKILQILLLAAATAVVFADLASAAFASYGANTNYRMRYASYRTNFDLPLSHQQFSWIPVWDDHEVADNTYRDAEADLNNTKASFIGDGGVSTDQRRVNAVRAYFESMPLRQVEMDDNLRISRNLQLGTLVDLTMLDTRHYDCSTTNLYYTSRAPESTVELSLTQIEVTAATATSPSPVSNVKGVAFGRFFQVWLEDTDYSASAEWFHRDPLTGALIDRLDNVELTLSGCKHFCGGWTFYWDAGARVIAWAIPGLLLLSNIELSPIDKRRFMIVIRALGNPIPFLWSLAHKIYTWHRSNRRCDKHLARIIATVPAGFEEISGARIVHEVYYLYYYRICEKLGRLAIFDEWHKAARQLADGRTNELLRTVLAIIVYVFGLIAAFSPDVGGGNTTSPGGRIRCVIFLSWLVPVALLSNTIGTFASMRTCLNIMSHLMVALSPRLNRDSNNGDDQAVIANTAADDTTQVRINGNNDNDIPLKPLELNLNHSRTYNENIANADHLLKRESSDRYFNSMQWPGSIYTYRPWKALCLDGGNRTNARLKNSMMFLWALLPVFVSALGAFVILWYAVPNGFSCRHVWVVGVFLCSLLSVAHTWASYSFAREGHTGGWSLSRAASLL